MDKLVLVFNCHCGSTECHREKGMEDLTFFDGHYHCSVCNIEFDYTSDELKLEIQKQPIQLQLFQ